MSPSEVPELDMEQVREDFWSIWQKNIVDATRETQNRPEAGNYGDDDLLPITTTSAITINIQGISSQDYGRKLEGLIKAGSIFHAYVKWDTTLRNDDRIKWNGIKFVVKNWNDSMYAGQTAFRDFDLVVVDFY